MRAVIDTSVSFRAIAFNGRGRRVMEALLSSDEWEVVVSPAMIAQLKDVLERKAHSWSDVAARFNRYLAVATTIMPTVTLEICRDKTDDFILDCAASACADLLIAEDNDLLELSPKGCSILRQYAKDVEIISERDAYCRFVAQRPSWLA